MYDIELQKLFNDYVDRITSEVNQNKEQSTDLEYGLTLCGYEGNIINWVKDENFLFNIEKTYDEGDIIWYETSYYICRLDLTVGKQPTDNIFFKEILL